MSIPERWALWRYNRAAVHRYWAALSWRSCNDLRPWWRPSSCLRCAWRDITGQRRRAKQRYIQELRRRRLTRASNPFPDEWGGDTSGWALHG